MSNVQDLAPEIQRRVSGFSEFLTKQGFSRPEVKNIGSLLQGMLRGRDVHVSVLGRTLGEAITPKKTEERLHRNLRREGLWKRLLEANAAKQSGAIRRKRFCIIDVSDIQKPYALKMEGLGRVRDGDKSRRDAVVIGNGLWWINGVMADETGILPVYSELYGLDYEGHEHTSENRKILEVSDLVNALHTEAIHVLDRGCDRSSIIDCFIENGRRFIIRGQDKRSLRLHMDSDKETNIRKIAERTRLSTPYKSLKNGEWFDVGIRQVYYGKTPLWLVVTRRRRGGLSWYLTTIKGTRREIMATVVEGYGYRWRVEEYHRQIKQDYGLEKLCLRTYNAIKNMGVLVALAASFCASLPEHIVIRMIAAAGLLPRKRVGDIPDYPYYMITAAVAWVLDQTRKRPPKPLSIRKRDYLQLNLALQGV